MPPLKLKIKVLPGDFVVREATDIPLTPQGEYGVYRLTKTGWNTVDALREIGRKFNLPSSALAYGGKKDRHGQTSQTITIRDAKDRSFTGKNYSLELLGRSFRAMDPYFIQANAFDIVVRQLSQASADHALRTLEPAKTAGFPNYFDDQRFGSYDPDHGFLGEKVLKQHWNGALRAILLSIHPQDKKHEKDRKKRLGELWKNWKACREAAGTKFEREAFEHLEKAPDDLITILNRLPKEDIFMSISAYQSYLWNEMVRRLLAVKRLGPFKSYPGATGDYVFYTGLAPKAAQYLDPLILPLPGLDPELTDPTCQTVYTQVMNQHGITQAMLRHTTVRQAQFRASPRPVIVHPEGLTGSLSGDERYPGHQKLTLSFTLRRGAYATMLLKRLFV